MRFASVGRRCIKVSILSIACLLAFIPAMSANASGPKSVDDVRKDLEKKHDEIAKAKPSAEKTGFDVDLDASSFSSDTRVGITNMTGNTRSFAVNGTDVTKYRYRRYGNTWSAGAFYSRVFSSTNNNAVGTSARFIYGNYRFDYFILKRFTWYVRGGGYTNELKGIDVAGQGGTGFKYYILMDPNYYLSASLGYNYDHEVRVAPNSDRTIHSAAVMLDYEHKLLDNLKLEEHIEAYEDVRNGREIRLNSNTSIKVSVTNHVGVALGVLLMFDNEPPPGYKKLDTITSFSFALSF